MTDDEIELAIRRLLDAYAHACDSDDAAAVAALFTDDGELRYDDRTWTGDEIEAFYASRLDLPSLHFTTGLRWTRRDATDGVTLVDSTCGFLAVEYPDDRTSLAMGRYVDEIRIDTGIARFAARRLVPAGRRNVG